MTKSQEIFRTQLASLRDRTLRALREGAIGDVEDGLSIYERLEEFIVREFARLDESTGESEPTQYSFSWGSNAPRQWLVDDYRDFLGQAIRLDDFRFITMVVDSAVGVLIQTVRHYDDRSFSGFLEILEAYTGEAAATLSPSGWLRARDQVLLHVSSTLNYFLSSNRDMPIEQRSRFSGLTVKFLSNIAKSAIDRRNSDDVRAIVFALEEFLGREETGFHLSQVPAESQDMIQEAFFQLRQIKLHALFGLDGWILYKIDHDQFGADIGRELRAAIWSRPSELNAWLALKPLEDGRSSDFFGWHWWETLSWQERGGIITIDEFVKDALLVRVIEEGNIPNDSLLEAWSASQQDRANLQFLLETFEKKMDRVSSRPDFSLAMESSWYPSWTAIKQGLGALKATVVREQEETLAAAHLDRQRIVTFRTAFEAAMSAPLGPNFFGPVVEFNPGDASAENASDAEYKSLGFNQLLPKYYFIDSHVHADPSDLAKNLALGLVRAEQRHVLDSIFTSVERIQVRTQDLADEVSKYIRMTRKEEVQPLVLVLGSWRLMNALREWAVDKNQISPFDEPSIEGSRVYREFGVDREGCLVGDLKNMGRTLWKRPAGQPHEEHSLGGRIVIGIRIIDDDYAANLLEDSPSLARGNDGQTLDTSSALRNLKRSVHVTIREVIHFELNPDPEAKVFEVFSNDS